MAAFIRPTLVSSALSLPGSTVEADVEEVDRHGTSKGPTGKGPHSLGPSLVSSVLSFLGSLASVSSGSRSMRALRGLGPVHDYCLSVNLAVCVPCFVSSSALGSLFSITPMQLTRVR